MLLARHAQYHSGSPDPPQRAVPTPMLISTPPPRMNFARPEVLGIQPARVSPPTRCNLSQCELVLRFRDGEAPPVAYSA
ncbi:MAG: hypothetical protein V7642_4270 [Burkholderiales bacterium]